MTLSLMGAEQSMVNSTFLATYTTIRKPIHFTTPP